MAVTAAGVNLSWQNVETVTVRYVPMDVGKRSVTGAVSLSWHTVPG